MSVSPSPRHRWLRRIAPPMFEDPEKNQLAWVLHWVLLTAVATLIPWLAYAIVVAGSPAPVALAEVVLLAAAAVGLLLVRSGRVSVVAVAFTVLFWVVIGVTAVFSGGVRGSAVSGYPLVVLTAAFFLGGRWAVWMAVASIAAAGTLSWAQSNDLLPPDPFGDGHALASWIAVIGATAVFAHLLRLLDRQRADADRRLRMALQAADTGTFEWHVARGELTWLGSVAGTVQQWRERFGGRYARYLDLVHPDDRERFSAELQRVREAAGPVEVEYRAVPPDGEERWFQARGEVVERRDGEPRVIAGTVTDITRRRRTEEALRRQVKRNRQILESMLDGYILIEPDGRIVDANRSVCNMLGYAETELRELAVWDIDATTNREAVVARFADWFRAGATERVETRYRRKDGSVIDVELTAVLVETDDGLRMSGFLRDVTERKRWETTHRESEERYRTLFENSLVGIGMVDSEGNLVEFNDAMLQPGGYTREDVWAMGNVAAFYHDPSDRDRILAKLAADGVIRGVETKFRRKDGSPYDASLSVNPVMVGGRPHALAIVEDITELKRTEEALRRSEARYRAIVEDQTEFIVRWLPDGTRTFVSRAYAEYYRQSVDELIGANFFPGLDAADRERIRKKIHTLTPERPAATDEHRVTRSDGSVGWHQWTDRGIFDDDGRLLEVQSVGRDVTERRRAESLMRESERRYRSLFADSRDAVYVTTHEGAFVEVNDAMLQLFGYDRHELTRISATDLYVDRGRRAEFQALIAEQGSVRDFPVRLRHKSGTVLQCLLTSTARLAPDGAIVGYQGVVRDVTEQRRAETALKASEERYRALVEVSPDAIVVHSDGVIVFANEAAAELVGAESAEVLLGLPVLEFVAAEDRDHAVRRIRQLLETHAPAAPADETFLRMDGSRVPVEVRARTVQFEGAEAVLVVVRNMSRRHAAERALRESERRFRAVFDQSLQLLGIVSPDGVLEDVNATALAMIGERREDVVGRPFWETPWWTYDAKVQERLRRALTTAARGEVVRYEVMHYDRKGDEHVVDATITPVRDETGTVVHILALGHDVTERKQVADALRRSREQLRQLAARLQAVREEERTAIAREIHDELGQALTGIKMDVSWLLGRVPKTWKRVRLRGHALTELLDGTIDAVRDLSSRLRPSVLDDLGLAAAVEWQTAEFARRTGIEVDLTEVQELPLDRERGTALFRILQEALTNVARHASASCVRVSLRRSDGEIVLRVADDGKGLTTAEIDDPTALGLLGMRERAAVLGGEVRFGQEPAGGTRVTASMPLGTAEGA